MRQWKVRTYRESDDAGIVNLINLVWPDYAFDIKRFHWFENNPFGHFASVGEHNGQIVGYMGLIPVDMKMGNCLVRGAQAVDLVVHPNFRRQGMFLEIGKACVKEAMENGISFFYGFPNEPAYQGHLKYGWFYVGDIPVLARAPSPYNLIRGNLGRLREIRFSKELVRSSVDLATSMLFSRKAARRTLPIEDLKITSSLSFDECFDDFWNRVSNRYGIIVVRSSSFLRWRYSEKPGTDYRVLVAENGGCIEGYVILSITHREGQKEGSIVDALASSKEVTQQLVQAAMSYFSEEEVKLIRCRTKENSLWFEVLKQNFLLPVQSVKLIARINSDQLFKTYESVAESWYTTMGDTVAS
jgi:GNAT superfamily N-acetyltransferase